ncbi:MAG: hypothetical protein QOG15_314 [Solirubrobacteraceae bacterium]|jgi:hypothetical protein|nr:hypothetical protein [Solirubrobacteraceae bacterium]
MEPRDETPSTAAEIERSERGRELIAAALGDPRNQAPASLREALEDQRTRAAAAAAPAARRRFGLLRGRMLAAGGAFAAVIVVIVLAVGGGSDGGPSIDRVAAYGRQPATAPAPATVPGTEPAQLNVAVEGLNFPDWQAKFAWRATGRRADRVGGRDVTTVFYRTAKGATLGYAIVAGKPIGGAPAGDDVVVAGETYRVAHGGGRTTVTWTQDGHTCVIDAPSAVPDARLVALASWDNA